MNVQNDATAAAELVSRAILPSLLIDHGDLPAAVKAITKLLKNSGQIYDMGGSAGASAGTTTGAGENHAHQLS